ncbi:hypothetical protein GGI43DRAFT_414851 [Trichoderma evansii]
MRLEIDPHGDTLITFQDANTLFGADLKTAPEKQFLVSRKHLMLASRRASKVLEGSLKEATPEEDGLFHWNFEPIFDAKAFEIVMKIIHGQTRDVPVTVNVCMLSQITAIVDDLECQNSVWFFAKGWLSQIKGQIPRGMSEDLMRWILISFVFEESEIFKTVTGIAIGNSTDIMLTLDLPIRSKILEDMSTRRKSIFSNLIYRLHNLESQLLEQSLGCNQGCRAMMLGTFSQGLKLNSLLPLPLPPYYTLRVTSILLQLRKIKGPDYYCPQEDCTSQTYSGAWKLESRPLPRQKPAAFGLFGSPKNEEKVPSSLVRHNCRLEDHLKGILDTVDVEIKGLELSNYLST